MNTEKLRLLASHLRSGKLFFEWNFSRFREVRYGVTCGCACSELSKLFELDVLNAYLDSYALRLKGGVSTPIVDQIEINVRAALDLTRKEFEYLFIPIADVGGDSWLTEHATASEVADLIEHYIQTRNMLYRSEEEMELLSENVSTEDVSNCVNEHA